jgi:hypothetical protein
MKVLGRYSCSRGGFCVKVFFVVLPFISATVSFVFAALIFRRYAIRRGPHLLLWGIGMLMYGLGGFCEGYHGVFGWNPLVFRLWYLFGAMLVASWSGFAVYLLASGAADILIILGIASFRARCSAQLNPAAIRQACTAAASETLSHGRRAHPHSFFTYGDYIGRRRDYSAVIFKQACAVPPVHHNILIAAGAPRCQLQPWG